MTAAESSLAVHAFILGPVQTNTWLLADPESREAVLVDPAANGSFLLEQIGRKGWRLTQIWLTHAHFDHTGAVPELAARPGGRPVVRLHPADLGLWREGGGAALFGLPVDSRPVEIQPVEDGMVLKIGKHSFEACHTPGHTAGHVVYCCREAGICLCGDLIFSGSVGRTDLPGGDAGQLEKSIRSRIYSLPEAVRLLPGHGPETSVGSEKRGNPFVRPVDQPESPTS